jgi:hemerythrin-like domain-containing protein
MRHCAAEVGALALRLHESIDEPPHKDAPMASVREFDAIALLTEDHKAVKKLFDAYQSLIDDDGNAKQKKELAAKICRELTVHARIEEEIFYPAVRDEIDDDDLMDEAMVEHASAKALIGQIEGGSPSDEFFDAKVIVLGEYVDHHVKEEQNEMFPKARKKIDVEAIGAELKERKEELLAELEPASGGKGKRSPAEPNKSGRIRRPEKSA